MPAHKHTRCKAKREKESACESHSNSSNRSNSSGNRIRRQKETENENGHVKKPKTEKSLQIWWRRVENLFRVRIILHHWPSTLNVKLINGNNVDDDWIVAWAEKENDYNIPCLHIEIVFAFFFLFLFRRIQPNAAAIEYAKNPLS